MRLPRSSPAPGRKLLPTTAFGAIVFYTEAKVLLVQRAATKDALPNRWDIPGGTVDMKEETPLQGFVRRLRERS